MKAKKSYKIEKEWKHKGLDCKVIFVRESHRCGYVAVPEGHPAYNKDFEDIPVDVHGGLTYGAKELAEKEYEDKYWLGFDCAHLGDKILGSGIEGGHFWTKEEVVKETEKLAEQLANLSITDLVKFKLKWMPDWFKEHIEVKEKMKAEELKEKVKRLKEKNKKLRRKIDEITRVENRKFTQLRWHLFHYLEDKIQTIQMRATTDLQLGEEEEYWKRKRVILALENVIKVINNFEYEPPKEEGKIIDLRPICPDCEVHLKPKEMPSGEVFPCCPKCGSVYDMEELRERKWKEVGEE